MARGQSASTGRTARSERGILRSDIEGLPREGKVPAGLKSIREASADVPFFGDDGRISPNDIKEGILTIREAVDDKPGKIGFRNIMGEIESELGAAGKLTAAGVVTDAVELAYLRKAQEQREAETSIDDIIGSKRAAAKVIEQYDKDIADAESRIKDGLYTLAQMSPAGKKWSKSLPNEVSKALNSIGTGEARGGKKLAKYDTKGVRVMLNDIYESLIG